MIDMFTLLLVHGLLFVALYRLMTDDVLDSEAPPKPENDEGAGA